MLLTLVLCSFVVVYLASLNKCSHGFWSFLKLIQIHHCYQVPNWNLFFFLKSLQVRKASKLIINLIMGSNDCSRDVNGPKSAAEDVLSSMSTKSLLVLTFYLGLFFYMCRNLHILLIQGFLFFGSPVGLTKLPLARFYTE